MKGHPVLAAILDVAMRPLARVRRQVVPEARGEVLELGAGTGLNFPLYRDDVRLTAIEPDPYMMRRAHRRVQKLGREVRLDESDAESLPYADERFDVVVATFVLCTIPNPVQALSEARRVLRPGGRLLFAEHVANRHPVPRWLQDEIDPLWGFFAGGCHLNRDATALIEAAGFAPVEQRPHGGQRFTLSPVISGAARPKP